MLAEFYDIEVTQKRRCLGFELLPSTQGRKEIGLNSFTLLKTTITHH
jgi:hypothetical protein